MSNNHAGPPVCFNQTVELTIDNYGHEGDGVGRVRGFTVFVAGALQGERVKARIYEVKKNFARGRLIVIVDSAPTRIRPACPVYADCGGCQLQHLDYRAQLELKRRQISDALERIGGLAGVAVRPTIGMSDPWYYRNKAQYPFGMADNAVIIGFYRKGTHRMVATESCLLQTMVANWVAEKARKLAEKYRLTVYDETTGTGLLRHLLIKKAFGTGEIMVALITNQEEFPEGPALARELTTAFPAVKSVVQNINPTRDNVILGGETRILAGAATITEILDGLRFQISAASFFQVNPVQAEVLYKKAVEFAALSGKETVLDAYCGVGSLTLFLARRAGEVYGIEAVPEAVADARRNAELNGMGNVRFLAGRTEAILPQLGEEGVKLEAAVVDPPRSGCEPEVLRSLAASGVGRIVYVSCNPGTLARDLKVLGELGYRVEEVQPVDMFPQTYHVECVARVENQYIINNVQ